MSRHLNKLPKSTKLCSVKEIDALFATGKGALAYPLRLISLPAPSGQLATRFLISVPKKRLRHAVDRVLMRRRIREAYRLNREIVSAAPPMNLALVYVSSELLSYGRVADSLRRLLTRLVQTTDETPTDTDAC